MTHEHHHHEGFSSASYPREVRRVLWFVLFLNWGVAFFKLFFGYAIRSTSMVADGYHSLTDGVSNIIGLLGMRLASQPKDPDHPYGHKKYETFASIFIVFLLFFVCYHILHDSIERLRSAASPQITGMSFFVMGSTMLVNIVSAIYEHSRGKALGSDILIADASHTRADILTSLSVMAAFVGVWLGYPVLDSLAAVIIALFIGLSAVEILRHTSSVLCDTAVIEAKKIEEIVLAVPGVRRCHRVRTRGRRDDVHIDLHVLLDDKVPLVAAHDTGSSIEAALKSAFCGVTDVVVHLEPLSSEGDHHRND